jgi:hypothetical protein
MNSGDTPKKSSAQSASDTNAAIIIFKTLADTTWRMFVPPALGAVIGLQLEAQGLKQAAVWGAIIGVLVSGLLVWQQYRSVNSEGKK